ESPITEPVKIGKNFVSEKEKEREIESGMKNILHLPTNGTPEGGTTVGKVGVLWGLTPFHANFRQPDI
ncbi:MAG: hypothetical protein WD510_00050, partial [Balneolaceae bacterium]